MSKAGRIYLGAAVFALSPACFIAQFALLWLYSYSRPADRDLTRGFVHPLSIHGAYVYISDAESTGLALLGMGFPLGFLAVALLPLRLLAPPRSTPRWITHILGAATFELGGFDSRAKIIFYGALAIYLLAIWLAGPSTVRLLVANGFVLNTLLWGIEGAYQLQCASPT